MLLEKIKNPSCRALILFPSVSEARRQAYDFYSKLSSKSEPLLNVTDSRVVFPNGAWIKFDGYTDDHDRFLGHEYDYIGVTGRCPLTHDTETFLRNRLRGPDAEFVY